MIRSIDKIRPREAQGLLGDMGHGIAQKNLDRFLNHLEDGHRDQGHVPTLNEGHDLDGQVLTLLESVSSHRGGQCLQGPLVDVEAVLPELLAEPEHRRNATLALVVSGLKSDPGALQGQNRKPGVESAA